MYAADQGRRVRAGAASLEAAVRAMADTAARRDRGRRLRRAGGGPRARPRRVEVTVVDRHNHHVFQPLLYQVATAGLSPADIAAPIRWILRRQRNVRVLLGEVTASTPRRGG